MRASSALIPMVFVWNGIVESVPPPDLAGLSSSTIDSNLPPSEFSTRRLVAEVHKLFHSDAGLSKWSLPSAREIPVSTFYEGDENALEEGMIRGLKFYALLDPDIVSLLAKHQEELMGERIRREFPRWVRQNYGLLPNLILRIGRLVFRGQGVPPYSSALHCQSQRFLMGWEECVEFFGTVFPEWPGDSIPMNGLLRGRDISVLYPNDAGKYVTDILGARNDQDTGAPHTNDQNPYTGMEFRRFKDYLRQIVLPRFRELSPIMKQAIRETQYCILKDLDWSACRLHIQSWNRELGDQRFPLPIPRPRSLPQRAWSAEWMEAGYHAADRAWGMV